MKQYIKPKTGAVLLALALVVGFAGSTAIDLADPRLSLGRFGAFLSPRRSGDCEHSSEILGAQPEPRERRKVALRCYTGGDEWLLVDSSEGCDPASF